MVLFENTEVQATFEDIDAEFEMLKIEDLSVKKPEAVLYFNKERKLDNIDDVVMMIPFTLDGLDKEVNITVTYTCNNYDETFDITKLDDDIYEVEELADGYMITVDNLYKLSKLLKASFTQSVVYPFDNESKNDAVNKYLEKDNIPLATKLAKYINDLVYKVTDYKTVHQSWSNKNTRQKKKEEAIQKARAGRTDAQILLDDIKKLPGVKNVLTGFMREGAKYATRWRVFASYMKRDIRGRMNPTEIVIEILVNKSEKKFLCRVLNDSFNGSEMYSTQSVLNWVKNKLNIKHPVQETPIDDDDDDNFDLTSLGLEESKNARLKNGNGKFRKCSNCGKTITSPDDCDFSESEDCLCAACGRARTKRRSKGNEFMEALNMLNKYGYKIIK